MLAFHTTRKRPLASREREEMTEREVRKRYTVWTTDRKRGREEKERRRKTLPISLSVEEVMAALALTQHLKDY